MTNKNVAELDIDSLERQTFDQLQGQTVTAVVLALGSNHQSERHLATVREDLAKLGEITLSNAFQNPDFTATLAEPKPDYTNQCVYLVLTTLMTLQQLQKIFKSFEDGCNRQRQSKSATIRHVTMDIDVLLVKLEDNNKWIVIAERYPFKVHEYAGVAELASGNVF